MEAITYMTQDQMIQWVTKRIDKTVAQKEILENSDEKSLIRVAAKGGKQCVYKEMLNFLTTHKIIEK